MGVNSRDVVQYVRRLGLPWRHYLVVQAIMILISTVIFFVLAGELRGCIVPESRLT